MLFDDRSAFGGCQKSAPLLPLIAARILITEST